MQQITRYCVNRDPQTAATLDPQAGVTKKLQSLKVGKYK